MMKSIVSKSVLSAALLFGLPALAEETPDANAYTITLEGDDAELIFTGLQIEDAPTIDGRDKTSKHIQCIKSPPRNYKCVLNFKESLDELFGFPAVGKKVENEGKEPSSDKKTHHVLYKKDNKGEVQIFPDKSDAIYDKILKTNNSNTTAAHLDENGEIQEGMLNDETQGVPLDRVKGKYFDCWKPNNLVNENVTATCMFKLDLTTGLVKKIEDQKDGGQK